jgi:hypothetical protein
MAVTHSKVVTVKLERSCWFGAYFNPLVLKPGCTRESLGELLNSTDVWSLPAEIQLIQAGTLESSHVSLMISHTEYY